MVVKDDSQSNLEEESKEFFYNYGLTIYESLGLEKVLAQIIIIELYDPENQSFPESILKKIKDNDKLTLGQLLKREENNLKLPPETIKRLNDALEKRNWLVHKFYFDAYSKIIDTTLRKELIESLKLLTQNFGNLNDLLITEVIKRMKHKGVPEDVLDQLAKEVLDELKG